MNRNGKMTVRMTMMGRKMMENGKILRKRAKMNNNTNRAKRKSKKLKLI